MASEAFYRIREIIASQAMPADIDAMRKGIELTARPLPAGVTGEMVDANGVPCELQTPDETTGDAIVQYVHGGGYVAGSIGSHRNLTGNLALQLGCPVLSVDYRLAPEHPHPAPVEDGVDVTLEVWPEMIHVWHSMAGLFPEADQGVARVAEYLSERLSD